MAVYTPLTQAEIAAFLLHYDVGLLVSYKGITEGVENTNYLLVTSHHGEQTRYILTLYEQRVNPDDLPFFLGFTEWLASRGIHCPKPVIGRQGAKYYSVKNRPAALIQFLEGQGSPHIIPRHLELTGELIANMHLAADGFPLSRPNALSLAGWRALFRKFENRADEITPGLARLMGDELAYLERHWPSGLPGGVVHADVFPDNVFFVDGNTDQPQLSGIIDFYFACNDFWMYDLVVCMNAWCFDNGRQFVKARGRALMDAYQGVRPISDAEREAMPVLARGAAMRFLVTRAYDWLNRVPGALVNPKDPMEYVAKLRFHQQAKDWTHYGIFDA